MPRPVLGDAVFDRLVRVHRASLERYARGLGASREDAEEIAATALLRAYQSPPGARLEQEWRAWLSTVARNLWIDARRRRQLRLVTDDGVLDSVASPNQSLEQIASTAEEARQICAAIALLPPAQRAAMYLREVRGLSYEEIADELGMTLKAVTATLQRARGNVKERNRLAQAVSGLALAPLSLIRRSAGGARSVGAFGAVAKVAVPVALVATAGGVAVVAEHHAAAKPRPAPALALQSTRATTAATPAKRTAAAAHARITFGARPPLGAAAAPPARLDPSPVQHSSAGVPEATAVAAAAATASTNVADGVAPGKTKADKTTGGHAAHARTPSPGRGKSAAQPRRGKSVAARASAGAGHAATRPSRPAPASTHSQTAADAKSAAAARHTASAAAHAPAAERAQPPGTAAATGAAAQSAAAGGDPAGKAGSAQAAPVGAPPAGSAPPQAQASEQASGQGQGQSQSQAPGRAEGQGSGKGQGPPG